MSDSGAKVGVVFPLSSQNHALRHSTDVSTFCSDLIRAQVFQYSKNDPRIVTYIDHDST